MPAHNAGKFITEAIESVLNQTYSNFELIIIDDGSEDDTLEKAHCFSDPRINVIQQPHSGVARARNLGLSVMKGSFLVFLDADDVLPPASLAARATVLESNQHVSFVDGVVKYYDSQLTRSFKTWYPSYEGPPLEELVSLSGKCFFGNTWMIRRMNEFKYEFLDGLSHGEDLLFYIRLADKGGLYAHTPEVVLHYRANENSAMQNLKGLELGYKMILSELEKMENIQDASKKRFRLKSRKIMLRSYLRSFRLLDAFRIMLNYQ